MARGWESKSVAGQQEEAEQKPAHARLRLSKAEAEKVRMKEGLQLSRRRVQLQIESSRDARHRDVLQQALAALDEKLAALGN